MMTNIYRSLVGALGFAVLASAPSVAQPLSKSAIDQEVRRLFGSDVVFGDFVRKEDFFQSGGNTLVHERDIVRGLCTEVDVNTKNQYTLVNVQRGSGTSDSKRSFVAAPALSVWLCHTRIIPIDAVLPVVAISRFGEQMHAEFIARMSQIPSRLKVEIMDALKKDFDEVTKKKVEAAVEQGARNTICKILTDSGMTVPKDCK